jgi:hypothetical protein
MNSSIIINEKKMVYIRLKHTTAAVIAKISRLISHTDPAPDPNKDSVSITKAFFEDIKDLFRNSNSGVIS